MSGSGRFRQYKKVSQLVLWLFLERYGPYSLEELGNLRIEEYERLFIARQTAEKMDEVQQDLDELLSIGELWRWGDRYAVVRK